MQVRIECRSSIAIDGKPCLVMISSDFQKRSVGYGSDLNEALAVALQRFKTRREQRWNSVKADDSLLAIVSDQLESDRKFWE